MCALKPNWAQAEFQLYATVGLLDNKPDHSQAVLNLFEFRLVRRQETSATLPFRVVKCLFFNNTLGTFLLTVISASKYMYDNNNV